MSEERKGQIAYALLKTELREKETKFSPELRRKLGNLANKAGVPIEEAIDFTRHLFGELLEEALAMPSKGGSH